MKGIDEMVFYTERTPAGKLIGRVQEFPDLRTKPAAKAIDVLSEIVTLASERMREIAESQWRAAQ